MSEPNYYATVRWVAADVQSAAPHLTEEEAESFLADNERVIQDRMVEVGNEAIADLLHMHGYLGGNEGDDT